MFVVIARKASSFLRQPLFVKLWFLPIWVLLGFSRLAVLSCSFQRLAACLGTHTGNLVWVPLASPRQEKRARLLARTIAMAAQYTPWTSNCFPQAIVARLLLGLYGVPYLMFFGVTRDSQQGALKAHAWVSAGRVQVSGGYSFQQYTVVGSFASRALSRVVLGSANVR